MMDGDGKIDRRLPLATKADVYKAKPLLKRRSRKHFVEDHIWVSIFWRQEQDHFTRTQRLGCAFALLFMNMIGNAMWYQTDAEGKNGIQVNHSIITFPGKNNVQKVPW